MAIYSTGQSDSGIDRALQLALGAELDDELASGELWAQERETFPEPIPEVGPPNRPWQRPVVEQRKPPSNDSSLWSMLVTSVRDRLAGRPTVWPEPAPPVGQRPDDSRKVAPPIDGAAYDTARAANFPRQDDPRKADKQAYMRWKRDRIGIVVVHGIGPQLAGQTLLDWTRPIITAVNDAAAVEGGGLHVPGEQARDVTDPVVKANMDFSGETFPVVQVRVPKKEGLPAGDPRGEERTWVFTEAWWASEVRAPSLATMIGWLGAQGGVGRIVQGIQQNMLGSGKLAWLGKVSLQPIVSVLTSFVLLLFLVLLALAKLIPIGPLREAVVLKLAASFLTDWFGGARTLLLDPAQSANVRHRLLMTIKALRAYGCRNVVIVAHSGGTMVSLMTLTDPAFSKLRVQKLITIGEALNLGWRLNDEDPDLPPPTPRPGDRMGSDLGRLQPDLQWRDFWATHDPAPSGQPQLPRNFDDVDPRRFTAERVYNRMAILEDHGTYWDNDEHFVIPLIREIDVPTGNREASRFYSDDHESKVRARRKERVGILALWRRALQSLPLLAILAAATVSAPGFVFTLGETTLALFGLIPGNELVGQFFNGFVAFFNGLTLDGEVAQFLNVQSVGALLYRVGTWTLEAVMALLLLAALAPARLDRLWGERRPWTRLAVLGIELGVGIGVALVLVLSFLFLIDPTDRARIVDALKWDILALLVVGAVFVVLGEIGKRARKTLRQIQRGDSLGARFRRDLLISLSALFLGGLLLVVSALAIGVTLVIVDGSTTVPPDGSEVHADIERFVIGAIAVLVVFKLLARLGTWRWDAWDVRERRSLRRRPDVTPTRNWPYLLAFVLSVIAFGATLIVALGEPDATWLDTALVLLGVAIVVVVVICLGKDTVDNDITVVSGGPGGGGGSSSGEPAAMSTPEPPRAAGA